MNMAKNTITHIEWSSLDLERSKIFYSGLFDWKIEPWGEEGYLSITPTEGATGGIMKADEVHPGASPVVYVEVDEIESYLEKAKELGGGVAVPKSEIPTLGWFAHVTDPDGNGNLVGLFQAAKQE
jgi:predicted enzyme related to lactoylglutathione lyase